MEKNKLLEIKNFIIQATDSIQGENIPKACFILGRLYNFILNYEMFTDGENNKEYKKEPFNTTKFIFDEMRKIVSSENKQEKPTAWKKIDLKSTSYDLKNGRLYFVRGKNIRHMAAVWNFCHNSFVWQGKPVHAEEYCEIPE